MFKNATWLLTMVIVLIRCLDVKDLRCELEHLFTLEVSDLDVIELAIIISIRVNMSPVIAPTCFAIHAVLKRETSALCCRIWVKLVGEKGGNHEVRPLAALVMLLVKKFAIFIGIMMPLLMLRSYYEAVAWICDLHIT